MAEKRRQRSAESEETETQQKQVSKRAKTSNHSTTMNNNGRPQLNQKMAQAALARIKKLESTQKTAPTTTTTNITTSTTPSSSSSPQSSDSSNQTVNPTNTQDDQPNPSNLLNHQTVTPSASDLQQQIKNLKDQIDTINKTASAYKDVVENQASLIDSIKSSLSCNICLEVLDSPYALLCGHIFCHKDLYAWFHRTDPLSDHYDSDMHSDIHEMDDDNDDDIIRLGNQRAGPRQTDGNSSDSEFDHFQLNRIEPANRGTTNGTNRPNQANLVGLMNEPGPGRNANPATLRPVSMHRRRKNLICPQCRAAVIRRPMLLYAVKEAAEKLKTTGTPVPSSSCPTGSFRNLVEQHRDEKDLTWGRLFESGNDQDRIIDNVRRDAAERRHVVVDLEDGVRRCSRCAWEIGNNGLCEGCGTRYASLDTDDSDDESYHAHLERRPFPVESGSDDGDSMARMVSQLGESDDSSDVQVVRRRPQVYAESDSDVEVEAQPSATARRRVAEEQPRRAASIAEISSSSPHSSRPHYSPSNHRDDRSQASTTDEDRRSPARRPVYRTGLAVAHGRIISSDDDDDGYSSNQSEPGSLRPPTPSTLAASNDGSHFHTDDHVSQSSVDSGKSDDDVDDEDRGDGSIHRSSSDASIHRSSDDDESQSDLDVDDHADDPDSDVDSDYY
ncbi:hypothetical protein PtA15_6A699 [Puccinia triticina]|uniref:Zinc finger RING-type eukaryotic domain-containing protein n=1 Tax=Puccinia triticina TaxID=208348 RepID=A0ABY7CLG3_9BASI|nr:uncharacterized protein PtA15_6A699 [Puccinia triticina]WAQ86069.1 hypothetical protein PtA15_6A699 [Puccinia triticina]